MTRFAIGVFAAFTALGGSGSASAAVYADRAAFAAASQIKATETFDSLSTATQPNTSLSFGNFTASASQPLYIAGKSSDQCNSSNCLNALGFDTPRTLAKFALGTTSVGFDFNLNHVGAFDYAVTAVTGSGTQTYQVNGGSGFFGLTDPTGITSISMTQLPTSGGARMYWAMDNVSTGYAGQLANDAMNSRSAFTASAGAAAISTETFENIPVAIQNSLTFSNATVTSSADVYTSRDCAIGKCLNAALPLAPRTFKDFAAGTTGVGFDLYSFARVDNFVIEVVTGTGIKTYQVSGSDRFFGVNDASGITSLTVFDIMSPVGVYSTWTVDNFSTFSAVRDVPEPATWAMMVAGFGLIGTALRRRPAQTAARA